MARLAIVLSAVLVDDTAGRPRIALSDKTLSGLRGFQARWPGPMLAVGPPVSQDVSMNLGTAWYDPADLDVDVRAAEPGQVLAHWAPDVVQLSLSGRDRPLLDALTTPAVVVAENPPRERLRYAIADGATGPRWRMAAGAARQSVALRRMVSRAAALACNGWAAWGAYAGVARRHTAVPPLLYFDHRLSAQRVSEARDRLSTPRDAASPLRLGFSGRLHESKGPRYAVAASEALARRGVEHTLTVFGDGPQDAALRRMAGPQVRFAGSVPFEPVWTSRVGTEVDVMVLPHIQGDPSGTYLESAGLGVPIAGFANSALRGHVEHGHFGWTVPVGRADALTDRLAELNSHREEIRRAALAGVDFATRHTAEGELDRRVEQFLAVHAAAQR